MPSRHRVALAIVTTHIAHGRRKMEGVIDYCRRYETWEICRHEVFQPVVRPEHLLSMDVDGVIAEVYDEETAAILESLSVPVVKVCTSPFGSGLPTVQTDNGKIGRMAAEHLLSCDLDRFAFVGPVSMQHARERHESFSRVIEQSGGKMESIPFMPFVENEYHVHGEAISHESLIEAIRALPLPVGIMAANDSIGFAVMEACRMLNLRCPEDVAVIGVDNDEIFCNITHPSMTSIEPNVREIGYQSAEMLDRLMCGQTVDSLQKKVDPVQVVLRTSTDMTHSVYPEVARALRFIRSHADMVIDVTNVLDVVPVSRRWLEMKFKEEVGHGIFQEIRRVHVEQAMELLKTTNMALSWVAKRSGFNSIERLEFAFQKVLGMSATKYRKQLNNLP